MHYTAVMWTELHIQFVLFNMINAFSWSLYLLRVWSTFELITALNNYKETTIQPGVFLSTSAFGQALCLAHLLVSTCFVLFRLFVYFCCLQFHPIQTCLSIADSFFSWFFVHSWRASNSVLGWCITVTVFGRILFCNDLVGQYLIQPNNVRADWIGLCLYFKDY